MKNNTTSSRSLKAMNGWLALVLFMIPLCYVGFNLYTHIVEYFFTTVAPTAPAPTIWSSFWTAILFIAILVVMAKTLFVINPKHGLISSFMGHYKGEFKKNGFYAFNPLYSYQSYNLSLCALTTSILKVNDKDGNPINIGATITYYVDDMYKYHFEIANNDDYLSEQSDAALRTIAAKYSYKDNEFDSEGAIKELEKEMNEIAGVSGIIVKVAKFIELSYAEEIAAHMLQKQQAAATIEAKKQLVEGAVGIVEDTIAHLGKKDITLDEAAKVKLTINLLTVLAGDKGATPIIATEN